MSGSFYLCCNRYNRHNYSDHSSTSQWDCCSVKVLSGPDVHGVSHLSTDHPLSDSLWSKVNWSATSLNFSRESLWFTPVHRLQKRFPDRLNWMTATIFVWSHPCWNCFHAGWKERNKRHPGATFALEPQPVIVSHVTLLSWYLRPLSSSVRATSPPSFGSSTSGSVLYTTERQLLPCAALDYRWRKEEVQCGGSWTQVAAVERQGWRRVINILLTNTLRNARALPLPWMECCTLSVSTPAL